VREKAVAGRMVKEKLHFVFCVVVLSWCAMTSVCLSVDYVTARQPALSDMHNEYAQVIERNAPADSIRLAQQRVAVLDRFTSRLLEGLAACHSASSRQLLGDVLADTLASVPTPKAPARRTQPIPDPLVLFAECAELFDPPLDTSALSAKDAETLRSYLQSAVAAAMAETWKLGKGVSLSSERFTANTVIGLSMVLPLLHTPDKEWSEKTTEALPGWLRETTRAGIAEWFCIRAGRPRAAWHLSRHGPDASARSTDLLAYLESGGDHMLSVGNLPAALACCRAGSDVATESKDDARALEFCLKGADCLQRSGYPDEAAGELDKVLARHSSSDRYGELVVRQLKHLYSAEQFDTTRSKAEAALADKRLSQWRRQLVYLLWLTARRTADEKAIVKWQSDFLEHYPQHAWSAEIHFHWGMRSFVDSDYASAQQQFALVRKQFPNSESAETVEQFESRVLALGLVAVDEKTGLWMRGRGDRVKKEGVEK